MAPRVDFVDVGISLIWWAIWLVLEGVIYMAAAVSGVSEWRRGGSKRGSVVGWSSRPQNKRLNSFSFDVQDLGHSTRGRRGSTSSIPYDNNQPSLWRLPARPSTKSVSEARGADPGNMRDVSFDQGEVHRRFLHRAGSNFLRRKSKAAALHRQASEPNLHHWKEETDEEQEENEEESCK
jgi:hypothetical protein